MKNTVKTDSLCLRTWTPNLANQILDLITDVGCTLKIWKPFHFQTVIHMHMKKSGKGLKSIKNTGQKSSII